MASLIPGNVRLMSECLTVPWSQPFEEFGTALATALDLPEFEYDAENVYEWGQTLAENGLVEVNISREHGWLDAPIEWGKQWMSDYLLSQYVEAVDAIKTMQ